MHFQVIHEQKRVQEGVKKKKDKSPLHSGQSGKEVDAMGLCVE